MKKLFIIAALIASSSAFAQTYGYDYYQQPKRSNDAFDPRYRMGTENTYMRDELRREMRELDTRSEMRRLESIYGEPKRRGSSYGIDYGY